MPTIRLATDDDMRQITSRNLDEIFRLRFLYIATDQPDLMRSWCVGLESSVADTERLHPATLIAPHRAGATASRGDLLYNEAEPAAALERARA